MTDQSNPVLLYDGVCGFCNSTVRFIIARDRKKLLRFASLQSNFARGVLERHPDLRSIDSLVLIEQQNGLEKIFIRSDGAFRVASYLGGPWNILLVFQILPRPLRDAAYDLFARYRYALFGRYDSCPIPDAHLRSRFIE